MTDISHTEASRAGRASARVGLATGLIKLGNAGFGVINAVLLARLLGAAEFGQYAFIYAVVTILSLPVAMGVPMLVVRETATLDQAGDTGAIRALWRWAARMILITSLVVAVVAVGYVLIFGTRIAPSHAFLIGLVLMPLIAFGRLRGAALRGLGQIVLGQLPETVLRPAIFSFLILVSAFLVLDRPLSAVDALVLHIGAAMAAFLIGSVLLLRFARRFEPMGAAPDHSSLLKSALALGLVTGLTTLNSNIDIVMIGVFLADRDVGIYRPMVVAAGLVFFGMQVVNTIITPQLARLYKAGEIHTIERLVRRASGQAFLLALAMVFVIVLAGQWGIALLLGAEFSAGYAPLVILSLAQALNVAFGPGANVLNMAGYERTTLWAIAAAVAMNVVLNAVLIQSFGITGAAIGTLLALVFYKAVLAVMVRRKLGIRAIVF